MLVTMFVTDVYAGLMPPVPMDAVYDLMPDFTYEMMPMPPYAKEP